MDEDIRAGAGTAARLAAGVPVREALEADDPGAWLALDAGVRRIDRYDPGPGLSPGREGAEGGRAAARRGDDQLTEPQLALALCHRDGRIREGALGRVAGYPALLPLVAVRCADWAAPVRETARRRLGEALDAESAVALVPLILRLGRRDRGDFAVRLAGEVLRAAPRERLLPLLTAADRAVRRFAHRLAVAERLLSPAELARTAARDTDTVVQSLCSEAALAAVAGDGGYDDVLGPLLTARGPRVRSAGVTALRRAGRPTRAEAFLDDRSALVRACARYVVRQHGIDPLPWYRARCAAPADPALSPGAAVGLAECGDRADAELLWPLLTHPAAGVRARAGAGLRLLDAADVRRLRPLLDDPAPGVVRETAVAVLPSADLVPSAWLLERLSRERPAHVRRAAFRLLDAQGASALRRAVDLALDDPDDRLRGRAEQVARRWRGPAAGRWG